MTFQIALLLSLLAIAVLLFVSEKLRPDLIALLVLLVLGLTNLVPPAQLFSGISSPSVILLISVFILTGGLFQTGVSEVIGRWLLRVAGESEARLVALVMLAAGGLSLFMNNIASGAVLMPAIMDVTRRTKISPSKLMLPMAFATQLAGMATLLTTANIVASGVLHDAGLKPFGLFDFLSVGGPAALAGILYMILVGRRWLPDRRPLEELEQRERNRVDLIDLYQIKERLHEILLEPDSSLIGKSLGQTGIGSQLGLVVLAIERNHHTIRMPSVDEVIQKSDVLLIAGRDEKVNQLTQWGAAVRPAHAWPFQSGAEGVRFLEVLLSPRSSLIGQSLKKIQFRTRYGLTVVALWRNGRAYRTAFSDFPLESSDMLLVYGSQKKFNLLQDGPDWLVLQLGTGTSFRFHKMKLSLLILAGSLVLAGAGLWPVHMVLFAGALATVLTGCLTMDEAYRSIDWRSVFLVGGMLSAGVALTGTGTAGVIGGSVIQTLGNFGPLAVAGGLFLAGTLLTQFIPGGSAVAAVLTPIAISAAQTLGADPRAYALVVAIAAGTSMLTPFAHPVNVLVMGPGGYRFQDYLRAGLPLVIITFAVVMLVLPLFWRI